MAKMIIEKLKKEPVREEQAADRINYCARVQVLSLEECRGRLI